jgi:hypothetical protein
MKLHLLLVLAWIGALPAAADELPEHEITLSIESATPDGHLKIGVHNVSSKEIRVWTDNNTWGYYNWHVVVLRGDEMRLYIADPREDFTMNVPERISIKPGKMLIENLQLGDGKESVGYSLVLMHWLGPKDTVPLLKNGDKIVVTDDVRGSMESRQYDVWSGITAVSKEYRLLPHD